MKVFVLLICVSFVNFINYAKSQNLEDFINLIDLKTQNLQGEVFAVIKNGDVIHKKTFGYQNIKTKEQITTKTLFPLGSFSKAITSIAIAKLVDENTIDVNEQILLPYLKNEITLKEILSHTTGYNMRGDIEIESGWNRQQLLKTLKRQKTTCNYCYFYSNIIFSLTDEALQTKGFSLEIAIENLNKSLKIDGIKIFPLKENSNIAYLHYNQGTKESPVFTTTLYSKYQTVVPASAGLYASLDSMIEFLN